MSVPKSKRGISKMEFYHTARTLRRELTLLTLRDFGVHKRKSMQPEGFYDEAAEEFSRNIRLCLRSLVQNITAANTIYPTNESEACERRLYQDRAIISCQQLKQEILYCQDVMPVKVSSFMLYTEKIDFEIRLLKGWRKACCKVDS